MLRPYGWTGGVMEPQIRYVKSADGTKIATASLGSGTPLVMIPATPGHIESYFSIPEVRATIDFFAERYRFVTYDPRGRGLSDRNVSDWSLDARVADLRAVFDGLSLPPSYLLGRAYGSIVGIAFSAQHPQLILRLGLYAGVVRGLDFRLDERFQVFDALREINWTLYSKFLALTWFDWTESGRLFAEQMARAFTPESFSETTAAARRDDASEYLDQIACPTLVIQPHGRAGGLNPGDSWREIAARVKDARVRTSTLTDWISLLLPADDALAFAEFFDEDSEPSHPETELPSGTAIILFADIADSTGLTERLGDAAFRKKARELDGALRAAMREHGGTPIEGPTLGDGVLAVFTSAREAIEAALACASAGNHAGLPLHLGIHAGDVIREKDPDGRGNVYGGAVNVASRIAGLSAAGEVLVSETVRSLARTSAGVVFEDRGEQPLKGVGEPVRVWAVAEAANQQTDKPANRGTA
jgi:class 3 adenylate cyclase